VRNLDSGSVALSGKANGFADAGVNGGVVAPAVTQKKKKQAGLVELVIGVVGIYASL
jgi:hypothetical protein